jgi:hypothetical protein
MAKHFPGWRRQVPILIVIGLLAGIARYWLDGYKDRHRPLQPDKPFVAPPRTKVTSAFPVAPLRAPNRPPRPASSLSILLSVMAEDPAFPRGGMGMLPWHGPQQSYAKVVSQSDAIRINTKVLRMTPSIEVPNVPLATDEYYNPEAEAVYYLNQWLESRAASRRAEVNSRVHQIELGALDLIARLKGQTFAQREALTNFWKSYRDLSRASTEVAELAAFDALAAVSGKSIVLNGEQFIADASRSKVVVRTVATAKMDSNDP